MLDCEQLKLLIVKFQTTGDPHRNDKSTNKESKIHSKQKIDNLCTNIKVNLEANYFVAGPSMETDWDTSTKRTIKHTMNLAMCSQVLDT